MQNYETVKEIVPRKGTRVLIGFDPDEVQPWRVGCRGAGHYFNTVREALAYCAGRRFVQYHMIDELAEEMEKSVADQRCKGVMS